MRRRISLLLVALLAPAFLTGFGGKLATKTREGNRFLAEGKLEDALRAYTDAQLEDPENPRLHFNIGTVKYREGKYDEAMESFRQALRADDRKVQRDAHYNIGNGLFSLGRLPEAIEAYKQALAIDPSFEDAKYNLEFARNKLKEQAQKQSQPQPQQGQQGAGEKNQQQAQGGQQQDQPEAKEEEGKSGKDVAAEQKAKDEAQAGQEQPEAGEEKQGEAAGPGELTPEQAQAILDALADSEKEAQEDLLRRLSGGEAQPEKDW